MTLQGEVRAIAAASVPVGVRVIAEAAQFSLAERFVLPGYEPLKDDRSRKAIEAAERWARNPTKKNIDACTSAIEPAVDAADNVYRDLYNYHHTLRQRYNRAARAAYNAAYAAAYVADAATHKVDVTFGYAIRSVIKAVDRSTKAVSESTVRQHLVDTDWVINYDWTEILESPQVWAPQFPYTHGPFRIWFKGTESCWTLAELRRRRRSRAVDEILVAIDAAVEGRR